MPQYALTVADVLPGGWSENWAWGLPLIVLTVVIHVLGMSCVIDRAIYFSSRVTPRNSYPMAIFAMVMSVITWFAIILHGIEAWIWATAYRLLGALPDSKIAVLYSLSAITSYGHTSLILPPPWQLMGSLEALNGWLLFGLTSAFMFGAIQKIWNHRELAA